MAGILEDGAELLRIRKSLKINQVNLSQILGISQQYLSLMENGHKPLNQKALGFIRENEIVQKPPNTLPPAKMDTSGCKEALTINKLSEANCTKNGQPEELADFDDFSTNKGWETWLWKTKHPLCLKCQKECKQSDKVKIIICPQYLAIKNESHEGHVICQEDKDE